MPGFCDVRGHERQDLCFDAGPLSGGPGDNLDKAGHERYNDKVHFGTRIPLSDTSHRPVGGDHGASGLDRSKGKNPGEHKVYRKQQGRGEA
eukprot:189396-Heterocapsa_arctica.AAC.1